MRTLIIALFIPIAALSATIYVPDNYPTIQDAVNAASDYDTIIVLPGTYKENIIVDKELTIRAQPSAVIDGQQKGSCISFVNGISDAVLENFSITNGSGTLVYDTRCGGGIYCAESTVLLKNNKIHNNYAVSGKFGLGGGVYIGDRSLYAPGGDFAALLKNNIIYSNETINRGGGVYIEFKEKSLGQCDIRKNTISGNKSIEDLGIGISYGKGVIEHNIVYGNKLGDVNYYAASIGIWESVAEGPKAKFLLTNNVIRDNEGSGLRVYNADHMWIVNNLILNNDYEGMSLCSYSSIDLGRFYVVNNIIWDSQHTFTVSIFQLGDALGWYHCNDIEDGYAGISGFSNNIFYWPTNIDIDPMITKNHHIGRGSPCRDTGDLKYSFTHWDIDGQLRYNDQIDMGPDEWWK